MQVAIDEESREFYEEAAAAAASLAICIDLYIVSPAAVGLRCLEPLAISSGGAVYLYPSLDEAALPQVLPSVHVSAWPVLRAPLGLSECRHETCIAMRLYQRSL